MTYNYLKSNNESALYSSAIAENVTLASGSKFFRIGFNNSNKKVILEFWYDGTINAWVNGTNVISQIKFKV